MYLKAGSQYIVTHRVATGSQNGTISMICYVIDMLKKSSESLTERRQMDRDHVVYEKLLLNTQKSTKKTV